VILIALLVFIVSTLNSNPSNEQSNTALTITPTQDVTVPQTSSDSEPPAEMTGQYREYSKELLKADRTNILFFRASWCPSCQVLHKNLQSAVGSLPTSLNILYVDYDESTSLKQQYGVVMQHTLVVVDQSGSKVKTLRGLYSLNTVDDIINALKKDGI